MRWLYHLRLASSGDAWPYAPKAFVREGFIHASFRDAVRESGRLYFPPDAQLQVVMIDPRKLDVPVDIASTPRGEMPHIVGPIPRHAVARVFPIDAFDASRLPDHIAD